MTSTNSDEQNDPPRRHPLAAACAQFHRTISGIRDLLSLVEPHLNHPLNLEAFLDDLDPDQRAALALLFVDLIRERGGGTATLADANGHVLTYDLERQGDLDLTEEGDESPSDTSASNSESEGGSYPIEVEGEKDATTEPPVPSPTELLETQHPGFKLTEIPASAIPTIERAARGAMPHEEVLERVRLEFADDPISITRFFQLMQGKTVSSAQIELLNRAMLITAVAAFEVLVARSMMRQLRLFPDLLARSEMQFSLTDLQALGSIDDARDMAIERRVDTLMRESFETWRDWYQKTAKIDLSDLCIDDDSVCETLQRRHILVHNDGRVSRRYVTNTGRGDIRVGDALPVTSEYLEKALDQLDVLGVALVTTLRCKWIRDEAEAAILVLHRIAFGLLCSERYDACIKLNEVGVNIGSGSEYVKTTLRVNSWIAKKQSAGCDEIREEVENWDVSALGPEFMLAKLVLLNNHEKAFEIIPSLLDRQDCPISDKALAEWPLFIELRQDDQYRELVESRTNGE